MTCGTVLLEVPFNGVRIFPLVPKKPLQHVQEILIFNCNRIDGLIILLIDLSVKLEKVLHTKNFFRQKYGPLHMSHEMISRFFCNDLIAENVAKFCSNVFGDACLH